ncbi:hypothetical protein [Saccharospirillum salsuginis]|uniref:Uncharacterized protein n=1 Tax=Saccharospirillum salsuginis TaxID=418750 RepID=A0A918N9T4_9GAMM|nr:hypothetical protein [Saccharospirillum salsuginis]GGX54621.1 hypothetical protein GCM10007392_22550 [Saccharospirillum salsuginis]
MKSLIKHVVIINMIAATGIFLLLRYVEAFKSTHPLDLVLLVVAVLWVLAVFMWSGGNHGKNAQFSEGESYEANSLVGDYDRVGNELENGRLTSQMGFVLFVASLPPLLVLVASFFL